MRGWEALDGVADTFPAVLAACAVAPFVATVDKAIAENASGKQALWTSFFKSCRQMGTSPATFAKQPACGYLAVLYGCTYVTANMFNTFEAKSKIEAPVAKSAAIFGVNASASLWKDSAFAKLFGNKAPAPVPYTALSAWWMRDFIGMAVIFVAPPIVAKRLHTEYGFDQWRAEQLTQIVLPLAVQPVVAPFHLFGYVLYNQPTASWQSHMAVMKRELGGTVIMRWIRVFPPFCIGTIINSNLRRKFKDTIPA